MKMQKVLSLVKTGVQENPRFLKPWMPTFAGMTIM